MGKPQEQTPELDSPHTEASKLLEAALQQMDGIISGSRMVGNPALEAAERLAAALQEPPPPPPPDPATAALINAWLSQANRVQTEEIR